MFKTSMLSLLKRMTFMTGLTRVDLYILIKLIVRGAKAARTGGILKCVGTRVTLSHTR